VIKYLDICSEKLFSQTGNHSPCTHTHTHTHTHRGVFILSSDLCIMLGFSYALCFAAYDQSVVK